MQDSATPDRNSPRSGDSMAHTQDELLAACLRAPRSEQERRLDEICARHPGIEDELREQFEVLVHVGLAGLASDEEKPDSPAGTGRRFGDFELLEVLAEGGMGVVHHARQVSLDREVIVKLIRPELMHFDATRERFTREAGAIAQLEHRGIVQVFASGEEDGVPYIAMERIDGVPLTRRIESDGAPAPSRTWVKESLDLAAQIADALHHAHARGILHRDVKPSNVLVSEAGQASLIDFGLHALDEETPSETERLTREGSAPGTLLYMAPEQLENGSFDVRSEVYALGATLYEMLTGEPPFRGPSRSATEQLIRRGGPTSLRRGRPAISTDVDA
ncbi:MAG: serine/threonine-protein kinase, partial [Planctomycetota bacterium]